MDRIAGIAHRGVILFDIEDCAFDTICGFRLGHDRIAFTDGFFAPMPPEAPMAWRLRACHGTGGRALLAANTAQGWRFIAEFAGIDRAALAAAIADGLLLDGGGAAWRPLTPSPSPRGGEGTLGRGVAGASPLPRAGVGQERARQQA